MDACGAIWPMVTRLVFGRIPPVDKGVNHASNTGPAPVFSTSIFTSTISPFSISRLLLPLARPLEPSLMIHRSTVILEGINFAVGILACIALASNPRCSLPSILTVAVPSSTDFPASRLKVTLRSLPGSRLPIYWSFCCMFTLGFETDDTN